LQGFPAVGVVDSGADKTGTLLKEVALAAHFKKRGFRLADKTPRKYDYKPFSLDGKMELYISFGEHTIHTQVYIKMDAHDPFLLSEGVH